MTATTIPCRKAMDPGHILDKVSHQEHDARFVFGLLSRQPSCLKNTRTSTLCWIVATLMLGCGHPAVLPCPAVLPGCQGLPMPRHTQAGGSPAGALMGVCPRQCLGGVNSRPNDHGDEQSTGAPVRWILNTMGPFDQQ